MDCNTVKMLFDYDEVTGYLFWKRRCAELFKTNAAYKSWNTKYSGKRINTIDGKGYIHCSIFGKIHRAHRIVWLYVHGDQPNIIDHINGDRTDNRIENLRNVNSQENHLNMKIATNNSSGITGVYLNKSKSLWCAQMKYGGKTYHIGSSKNLFDAVCLRKSEELKLGFSDLHGRANVK